MANTASVKLCLLGDFAVGKTSLVRTFVYSVFSDDYISTIGVKVSRKTVAIRTGDAVVELTMMLWDLAGSEEFDRIRTSYIRGSAGVICVCDITRPETLASVKWYAEEVAKVAPEAKFVLAANKSDLLAATEAGKRPVLDVQHVQTAAESLGAPYYFTSAKTGDQVESLFRNLGSLVLSGRKVT